MKPSNNLLLPSVLLLVLLFSSTIKIASAANGSIITTLTPGKDIESALLSNIGPPIKRIDSNDLKTILIYNERAGIPTTFSVINAKNATILFTRNLLDTSDQINFSSEKVLTDITKGLFDPKAATVMKSDLGRNIIAIVNSESGFTIYANTSTNKIYGIDRYIPMGQEEYLSSWGKYAHNPNYGNTIPPSKLSVNNNPLSNIDNASEVIVTKSPKTKETISLFFTKLIYSLKSLLMTSLLKPK